jgi:hypothetical protein
MPAQRRVTARAAGLPAVSVRVPGMPAVSVRVPESHAVAAVGLSPAPHVAVTAPKPARVTVSPIGRPVEGPPGPQGPPGPPGPPGPGLSGIQGTVSGAGALPPTGQIGEAWIVDPDGRLYVWKVRP